MSQAVNLEANSSLLHFGLRAPAFGADGAAGFDIGRAAQALRRQVLGEETHALRPARAPRKAAKRGSGGDGGEGPKLNTAYTGARRGLIGQLTDKPSRVLDVGCSNGALGRALRDAWPDIERIDGLDYDPAMVAAAAPVLDTATQIDLNRGRVGDVVTRRDYDLIVCADVLEHLVDPWTTLRDCVDRLTPGGSMLLSIPNVRHISTLYALLVGGRWPRESRGIHDATHLRWFTVRDMRDMVRGAGLETVSERRTIRLIERPHRINRHFQGLRHVPVVREFLTHQLFIVARKPA